MTTTRAEYFARWSASHGGYDPTSSPFVSRWLALVHACARPLVALHVAPAAVTVLGLALAAGAVPAAVAGGGWLFLACVLVLASGLVDSLDGAVAVMSGRAGAAGYVLDSVVDRLSDLLYLVVLWQVGAPAGVCVLAGALMFVHEYLRARATAAGMAEIGVVTVWERPTRVVVTTVALLGAALFRDTVLWSGPGDQRWATAAAWVWVVLGTFGLVQLSVVVARRLAGRGPVAPG